jgi:hypothetical protein
LNISKKALNRRITYIKKLWDNLKSNERENLIFFINNRFLLSFIHQISRKYYDELYIVIKEHMENSFEIIEIWEKNL